MKLPYDPSCPVCLSLFQVSLPMLLSEHLFLFRVRFHVYDLVELLLERVEGLVGGPGLGLVDVGRSAEQHNLVVLLLHLLS